MFKFVFLVIFKVAVYVLFAEFFMITKKKFKFKIFLHVIFTYFTSFYSYTIRFFVLDNVAKKYTV